VMRSGRIMAGSFCWRFLCMKKTLVIPIGDWPNMDA
jgi:hypothetical protein